MRAPEVYFRATFVSRLRQVEVREQPFALILMKLRFIQRKCQFTKFSDLLKNLVRAEGGTHNRIFTCRICYFTR
jgi:hypothetical protein